MDRWARVLAATVAAVACGCSGEPLTEIFVVVDSDLLVPSELDAVELEILRDPDPPLGPFRTDVDPVQRFHVPLPVTTGLSTDDPTQEITVIARGIRRTRVVLDQRARLSYVEGEVVLLCMRLDTACLDVACPPGATCRGGVCVLELVDSAALPLYQPGDPIACE